MNGEYNRYHLSFRRKRIDRSFINGTLGSVRDQSELSMREISRNRRSR